MSKEYTSAAEDAAAIRKALKLKGWTSKQISVRSDTYSMGSSVDVTIKTAGISKKEVEAIANRFDDVRRDENGDILSGGNRFVTVRFDHDLLAERAKKFRPIIDAIPLGNSSNTRVIAAGREFYVLRPERWRVTLAEHGEGGGTFQCMGEDVAASQLAQIDPESGADESPIAPPLGPQETDAPIEKPLAPVPAKLEAFAAEGEDENEPAEVSAFWDAPHPFLALDLDAPDPLEAYGPTGRIHQLDGLIIPEISPEPCYRAEQIGKGLPVNCPCEACAARKPETQEDPADLFTIWSAGQYVGQLRSLSKAAALQAFGESYSGYYDPEKLTALRVASESL